MVHLGLRCGLPGRRLLAEIPEMCKAFEGSPQSVPFFALDAKHHAPANIQSIPQHMLALLTKY